MADLHVNENSDIYYQGKYWNDLEAVNRRINERISGNPSRMWFEHFADVSGRTFERALILNCGNGWVERELLASGLILEAVGIDYSEDLLREAKVAADADRLPLTYEQANINTGLLPGGHFDLVVNHAAAHHIAAIDRVFRELCSILPEDGWFVSFDYVGPHRNQYAGAAWEEAWAVNRQLPESLRQDLRYPHLPTMLVTDPTEAIHSELIVETFRRYFAIGEFTPLGGAIAYPLLTHNARLFESTDDAERSAWVDRILEADDRFLREHPGSTLFAYFTGTPEKSALNRTAQLAEWESEETGRERLAAEKGGEYYPRGALSTALIALDAVEWENVRSRAQVEALQSELATLESGFLYSTMRRVLDADLTRRLRANHVVASVERRARAAVGRGSP